MGTVHSRKHRNGINGSSSQPNPPPYIRTYPPNQPTATATNSEMSCSLPYSNVDSNLRALAGQAEGFGKCAIGGLNGPIYHVTTLAGFYPSSFYLLSIP